MSRDSEDGIDSSRPPKRQRTANEVSKHEPKPDFESVPPRVTNSGKRFKGASYRPEYEAGWKPPPQNLRRDRKRYPPRPGDLWPEREPPKSTKTDLVTPHNNYKTPRPSHSSQDHKTQSNNTNTKSKKSRKTNPSTRIASLRKLLSNTTSTMPPQIRQEKQRELKSLLYDQTKTTEKQEARKTLQRYHMVRFFERQKAQRNVKRLKKGLDGIVGGSEVPKTAATSSSAAKSTKKRTPPKKEDDDESKPDDRTSLLRKSLWSSLVDVNYAIYTPLAEKYIGIFPNSDPQASLKAAEKGQSVQDFVAGVEQRNETSGVLHPAVGSMKPPRWLEVEEIMKQGKVNIYDAVGGRGLVSEDGLNEATRKKLELLRDGKLSSAGGVVGVSTVTIRNRQLAGKKRKAEEEEKGAMSEESEDDDEEGGMPLYADDGVEVDEDEDLSDGDGGFFER